MPTYRQVSLVERMLLAKDVEDDMFSPSLRKALKILRNEENEEQK